MNAFLHQNRMNADGDNSTAENPNPWGSPQNNELPTDASGKPYRRESHARSLIKGASWRIVATCDTVLVVALVTLVADGKMDLSSAIHIGLAEFLVKYIVYYFHERIWEGLRAGGGLEKSRTLKKAISWRIVATTMTFLIAWMVLGGKSLAGVALAIAIVEFFTKFALYYVHERVWARIPLGKIRNWLFGKKNA